MWGENLGGIHASSAKEASKMRESAVKQHRILNIEKDKGEKHMKKLTRPRIGARTKGKTETRRDPGA